MIDIKPHVLQPLLQAQDALAAINIAARKCKRGEAITIPFHDGSISLVPASDGRYVMTVNAVVEIPGNRGRAA